MKLIIAKAISRNRFATPQGIASFRAVRAAKVIDPQAMVKELRFYVEKLNPDSARLASDLIALIRAMVDRLNWLAEAGKLGDAPRGFETWPINYAPDASKGASKWEHARSLYQQLLCGEDAAICRVAGQVSYDNRWTALANDGVKAALLAKVTAREWDERMKNAKRRFRYDGKFGRVKMVCHYFVGADGRVIEWPEWAEKCRALPDKLIKENRTEFLPIIRELVRLYMRSDEKLMREFQFAVDGQNASQEWDARAFNNGVMRKVRDALESLARR